MKKRINERLKRSSSSGGFEFRKKTIFPTKKKWHQQNIIYNTRVYTQMSTMNKRFNPKLYCKHTLTLCASNAHMYNVQPILSLEQPHFSFIVWLGCYGTKKGWRNDKYETPYALYKWTNELKRSWRMWRRKKSNTPNTLNTEQEKFFKKKRNWQTWWWKLYFHSVINTYIYVRTVHGLDHIIMIWLYLCEFFNCQPSNRMSI